jgi:hypothetical protein
MGFFSVECHGCGKSILAPYNLRPIMAWMNKVVVIMPNGTLLHGSYDGYGRVDGADYSQLYPDFDPEGEDEYSERWQLIGFDYPDNWPKSPAKPLSDAWHEACWRVAGSPEEFRGGSPSAADQGYFFDERDYMIAEPKAEPKQTASSVKDLLVGQRVDVLMPHGFWMSGTVAKLGRKLAHVELDARNGGTLKVLPARVAPNPHSPIRGEAV